jgi:hypothetical protein
MRKPTLLLALIVVGFVMCSPGLVARQQATVLPISTFVDVLPATALQSWFDPVTGDILVIDMYAKRDAFFGLNAGTSVTGHVTVKDLGDGTQRVTLDIHTRNAICWGFNASQQPAFGYSPREVSDNLGRPSFGDAIMRVVFVQPAGPFDLAAPWEFVMTTVMCDGELRSGSGLPDGTPAFAQTTQIGLFSTGVPSGCPPEQDANCFPAEKVQFKPKGD